MTSVLASEYCENFPMWHVFEPMDTMSMLLYDSVVPSEHQEDITMLLMSELLDTVWVLSSS